MKFLLITKTLRFTPKDPPRLAGRYTYQRVAPGLGNVAANTERGLQLRRHVIPLDPKTPAQIARRALMRAAVTFWRSSTSLEKAKWERDAKNRSISIFNACVSDIMTNYTLVAGVLTKK